MGPALSRSARRSASRRVDRVVDGARRGRSTARQSCAAARRRRRNPVQNGWVRCLAMPGNPANEQVFRPPYASRSGLPVATRRRLALGVRHPLLPTALLLLLHRTTERRYGRSLCRVVPRLDLTPTGTRAPAPRSLSEALGRRARWRSELSPCPLAERSAARFRPSPKNSEGCRSIGRSGLPSGSVVASAAANQPTPPASRRPVCRRSRAPLLSRYQMRRRTDLSLLLFYSSPLQHSRGLSRGFGRSLSRDCWRRRRGNPCCVAGLFGRQPANQTVFRSERRSPIRDGSTTRCRGRTRRWQIDRLSGAHARGSLG